jgi:UDP-perosamine 4-acetyltransferase
VRFLRNSITRRVVVVGAGGHARVCIEALVDGPSTVVLGCVDKQITQVNEMSLKILGRDDDIEIVMKTSRGTHAFVAIGDNTMRAYFIDRCVSSGIPLASAQNKFAWVSPSAKIGAGTLVCAGAVVNAGSTIGAGVIVNTNATVDHDCSVSNSAHIAPASALAGGVRVGQQVMIGMGARILPGISIGDRAVVGAGAVVTKNVDADTTVVGIPARVIERRI